MKTKLAFFVLLVLVLVGVVAYAMFMGRGTSYHEPGYEKAVFPGSPLDAHYMLGDREIALADGVSEVEIVPGAASKAVTQVIGEPVWGDMNDDGLEDAALVLAHSEGGSGTFYYTVIAISDGEGYLGTNGVLLGDRINVVDVSIHDGVVFVRYAGHSALQAMAEEPTEQMTQYLRLTGLTLQKVGPVSDEELVLAGEFVYGHESRTFTPCNGEAHWLMPQSNADAALRAVYEQRTAELEPYTPIYIVLVGQVTEAPVEGFGADFNQGFETRLIVVAPEEGGCIEPQIEKSEDEQATTTATATEPVEVQ